MRIFISLCLLLPLYASQSYGSGRQKPSQDAGTDFKSGPVKRTHEQSQAGEEEEEIDLEALLSSSEALVEQVRAETSVEPQTKRPPLPPSETTTTSSAAMDTTSPLRPIHEAPLSDDGEITDAKLQTASSKEVLKSLLKTIQAKKNFLTLKCALYLHQKYPGTSSGSTPIQELINCLKHEGSDDNQAMLKVSEKQMDPYNKNIEAVGQQILALKEKASQMKIKLLPEHIQPLVLALVNSFYKNQIDAEQAFAQELIASVSVKKVIKFVEVVLKYHQKREALGEEDPKRLAKVIVRKYPQLVEQFMLLVNLNVDHFKQGNHDLSKLQMRHLWPLIRQFLCAVKLKACATSLHPQDKQKGAAEEAQALRERRSAMKTTSSSKLKPTYQP